MAFKTVLAPMIFEHTARVVAETAMRVAGHASGHVIGKHIRQSYFYYPPVGYGGMGEATPVSFDAAMIEASGAFASAQRDLFEEIAKVAGAHFVDLTEASRKAGLTASWSDVDGDVPSGMARAGRTADLSIAALPGQEGFGVEVDLIESLLMGSSRPVLLVPSDGISDLPRRILIAWDGSQPASRAIDAALPFLQQAEAVRLVTLKHVDVDTPDIDHATAYLESHDVKPTAELIPDAAGSIAKSLLDEAERSDSDLIVMGGYSHSRFEEAIRGGVTRYMLKHANRPLFMAH